MNFGLSASVEQQFCNDYVQNVEEKMSFSWNTPEFHNPKKQYNNFVTYKNNVFVLLIKNKLLLQMAEMRILGPEFWNKVRIKRFKIAAG